MIITTSRSFEMKGLISYIKTFVYYLKVEI